MLIVYPTLLVYSIISMLLPDDPFLQRHRNDVFIMFEYLRSRQNRPTPIAMQNNPIPIEVQYMPITSAIENEDTESDVDYEELLAEIRDMDIIVHADVMHNQEHEDWEIVNKIINFSRFSLSY